MMRFFVAAIANAVLVRAIRARARYMCFMFEVGGVAHCGKRLAGSAQAGLVLTDWRFPLLPTKEALFQ